MKSTGVVRKLDELGRVVIPVEQRRGLDISVHDPVEINVEDGRIVIRKYHNVCVFCGGTKELTPFREKLICKKCMNDLKNGG